MPRIEIPARGDYAQEIPPSHTEMGIEELAPFDGAKVANLTSVLDGVLLKITLTKGALSPAQIDFVENTVICTSRLLHNSILAYKYDLPEQPHQQRGIVNFLPRNIQKIQSNIEHLGLAEIMAQHRDSNKVLLSDEQSWLEITEQLSFGGISLHRNPNLRPFMEDCASGLLNYLKLLAVKNGGLVMDQYNNMQLAVLVDNYNRYRASITQQ